MRAISFPVGPLGCTCSILVDPESKHAVVIDPGGDYDVIRERLDALGASVIAIVHTHTHVDHVGATAELQRATGARACIHDADRFLYDLVPVQCALLGIERPETAEIEGSLRDATPLRVGGFELDVLHTPGHTPGSVSFVASFAGETRVFTGDTLFRRGIGRTDLWGGDGEQILRSIRQRLLVLPDDAIVVPGHGPVTTIADERRANPFLA